MRKGVFADALGGEFRCAEDPSFSKAERFGRDDIGPLLVVAFVDFA